jgi:hypothetical protein
VPGHIPLPLLRVEALGGIPKAKERGKWSVQEENTGVQTLEGLSPPFNPIVPVNIG